MKDKERIKTFCIVCNKFIRDYPIWYKSCKRLTCSLKCGKLHHSQIATGVNNPNYKHGLTINGKKCVECGKIISFTAKYCNKCRYSGNRHGTFLNKKHSLKSKKVIGQKSSAKFTLKFKQQFKKTMIEKGYWIDPTKKSDQQIYFEQCCWVDSMFNRTDIIGSELLKENGVYHLTKKTKGCVRDHRFSKYGGYNLGIFPEILRHPCNCQIILHSDNVRKRRKDIGYGLDNTISLNLLLQNIKIYKGNWKEHAVCLDLVQQYERGEKWKR